MEVVVLTDGWRRGIRHSFDDLNYSKSSELTARLDFRSTASYVKAYSGSISKTLTNNRQAFREIVCFFKKIEKLLIHTALSPADSLTCLLLSRGN